jgi:hypothetical protein
MAEAALASATLIAEHPEGGLVELPWSVRYSDRDWTFDSEGTAAEQSMYLTMMGYLWGEERETLIISYSGFGALGEHPIHLHGRADWNFDEESGDYRNIDFHHVMKFGEDSWWGWILGSQIVVGGAIGAVAAGGGTTIATVGAGIGAAPFAAVHGATIGSAALVIISVGAKSILESEEPVPPPAAPEQPAIPDENESLSPAEGIMLVAISVEGELIGSALDGVHIMSGTYNYEETVADGTIEPLSAEPHDVQERQ